MNSSMISSRELLPEEHLHGLTSLYSIAFKMRLPWSA